MRVTKHRRDEAVVQRHRDTDVRAVEHADGLTLERGVDAGVVQQRDRARANHEVVHRDLRLALERVQLLAQAPRAVHGDLGGDVEVRHRRLAERHALGDGGAHRGERPVLELHAGVAGDVEDRPRAVHRRRLGDHRCNACVGRGDGDHVAT